MTDSKTHKISLITLTIPYFIYYIYYVLMKHVAKPQACGLANGEKPKPVGEYNQNERAGYGQCIHSDSEEPFAVCAYTHKTLPLLRIMRGHFENNMNVNKYEIIEMIRMFVRYALESSI